MAAHDALRTILPAVGLSEDRARSVEITGGGDPVLQTSFRIGETSAAKMRVFRYPVFLGSAFAAAALAVFLLFVSKGF